MRTMQRRAPGAAVVATLTGLAFALAGCGGDDDGDGRNARRSTTTSSSIATTSPVTAAPQPPAPPPETCRTPEEAAASLHDAWAAGDRAAAARCALPAAVDTLFGGPTGPGAGEYFAGCFGEASPVSCSYAYEGGAITFTVECSASLGTGCQVTAVTFVAD